MIRLEAVNKTYDRHSGHANHVLKDITLELDEKGFVCILGPSGCGKTTLLNVMGGLDVFDDGTVTVGAVSVSKYGTSAMEAERNRCFGYVFQNYYMLRERSVTYNVYMGLHALEISHSQKLERVKAALDSVNMLDYSRRKVGELSGGQQQRVALARAIARRPQIIFADEPTGNLDELNTEHVCRLLRSMADDCLVVMVTHEEELALRYADRIIRMESGHIVSDEENEPCGLEASLTGQMDELQGKDMNDAKNADAANEKGSEAGSSEIKKRRRLESPLLEARRFITEKGIRTNWLFACLILFSVMTVLTVGDYLTMSRINFEDFVITDSHILEVNVIRGGSSGQSVSEGFDRYKEYLNDSGIDMTFLPAVSSRTYFSYDLVLQMNTLSEGVSGFSFIPKEMLSQDTLIYGRMPETPTEIVADRIVLERFLEGSGVLQASISGVEQFIGKTLTQNQRNIKFEIVGICDSTEPAIYLDDFALLSIGSAGTEVMSLGQLKELFPGKYDDITLEDNEILIGPNAGIRKIGDYFNIGSSLRFIIKDKAEEDIYAQLVIADDMKDVLLETMIDRTRHFLIYSQDKDAAAQLLRGELPDDLKGVIQVEVTDHYTDYVQSYRAAMAQQLGARMIVTVTILLAAAVMLIVLLRARVNERVEFLAVYRLLGVPKKRPLAIFALEGVLVSLVSALPAAIVTWAVIKALTVMPSISFTMELPVYAALLAYCGVLVLHLAASLFPTHRLLGLSSAQLAVKYDF